MSGFPVSASNACASRLTSVAMRVPSGLNATANVYHGWRGRSIEIFPVARSQIGVLNNPPLVTRNPSGLKAGVRPEPR